MIYLILMHAAVFTQLAQLDLRMIKIKKYYKHKEGTRIEFLAGSRAVEDSFKKRWIPNLQICRYLNCNENEAINGIKNLNENLKEAKESNKSLNIALAEYQVKELVNNAETVGKYKVIKNIFDEENVKIRKQFNNSKLSRKSKYSCIICS